MEVTEELWWETFEKYGEKFAEARPDYDNLDEKTQEIGALFQFELDIYNGGFLQAFCNWGYNSYLLEIKALEKIGANNSKRILEECYSVIVKLEDEEYWEDEDNVMEKMYNFYHK